MSNFSKYVVGAVLIQLSISAKHALSYSAVTETNQWLTTWTPAANFKATLADSVDEGVTRIRQMLQESLVPSWLAQAGVRPEHFEFAVTAQDIKDGLFWLPGRVYTSTFYPVGLPSKSALAAHAG